MKIILFNDTSNEDHNPGCKATMNALIDAVSRKYSASCIDKKPIGFKYSCFQNNLTQKKTRSIGFFGLFSREPVYIQWRNGVKQLSNDKPLIQEIDDAELVIINMEGTIHHNSVGALSLLGIAYVVTRRNTNIIMTNGTIQAINEDILTSSLSNVDKIIVREKKSSEYLAKLNIAHIQGVDFAFDADIWRNKSYTPISLEKNAALYTGGVKFANAKSYSINLEEVIGRHMGQIKKLGYFPYYLQLEDKEHHAAEIAKRYGARIINMRDYKWHEIHTIINNSAIVISGRYHIILFAISFNRPFIALESNSWKINGLFKLLSIDCQTISHTTELCDDLISKIAVKDSATILNTAKELLNNNL